jgi:hypothetical protein
MSMARSTAVMEAATQPKKLSKIKDKEERRWAIEDAARTFERLAETKREIKRIKADPELFGAVQAFLAQKIADMKAAKKV